MAFDYSVPTLDCKLIRVLSKSRFGVSMATIGVANGDSHSPNILNGYIVLTYTFIFLLIKKKVRFCRI